jgi:DNA excision repair protein ERCC-3
LEHKPLLAQGDGTLFVEKRLPGAMQVCRELDRFAWKLRSSQTLETYRIDRYSLWEAAARGIKAEEVIGLLDEYGRSPLPLPLVQLVRDWMESYGQVRLVRADEERFLLTVSRKDILEELSGHPFLRKEGQRTGNGLLIPVKWRGEVKRICLDAGYPALDEIGTEEGRPLSIRLVNRGNFAGLRDYQREAVEAFCDPKRCPSSGGVIVLPCGAGKTVTALAVMEKVGRETLILTPGGTSSRQWIREILDKTSLSEEDVGEYSSERKEIRPVTVTTYQMLTFRERKTGRFPHMGLFMKRDWGLIIYDEVHLLPAPVFRATSQIQGKRRLGLTATLVREDGRQGDVFSLIGPRVFECSWKQLEEEGWISRAVLSEVRVPFEPRDRARHDQAEPRERYRLAAENPRKLSVVGRLLERHRNEQVLIIGQYLDQLKIIADTYSIPIITGETPQERREEWYRRFRNREIPALVVSKVANMAVDLPNASVAIQVSGAYGSRQEEAQRLGRVLRPSGPDHVAHFYHVVTDGTIEQEYAWRRRSYLRERGYHYQVLDMEEC